MKPHSVMVSATREMIWRSECSRSSVPDCPRKYFCATMLEALSDHEAGNSVSFCSKATEPSKKLVMRVSRFSHSTLSNGSTPETVKCR